MIIEFVDKNGRRIIITCSGENYGDLPGEVVMRLLDQIPDSEFIMRPVTKSR